MDLSLSDLSRVGRNGKSPKRPAAKEGGTSLGPGAPSLVPVKETLASVSGKTYREHEVPFNKRERKNTSIYFYVLYLQIEVKLKESFQFQ